MRYESLLLFSAPDNVISCLRTETPQLLTHVYVWTTNVCLGTAACYGKMINVFYYVPVQYEYGWSVSSYQILYYLHRLIRVPLYYPSPQRSAVSHVYRLLHFFSCLVNEALFASGMWYACACSGSLKVTLLFHLSIAFPQVVQTPSS